MLQIKDKKLVKFVKWNVRTMMEAGKMRKLADELSKYNIDIAALQEIRWRGQKIIKIKILFNCTTADQGGKDRLVWDLLQAKKDIAR